MSHFSVLVRLPADVGEEDFETRIGEMMLPYKESGAGDADPSGLAKYLEFNDEEDAYHKQYETESSGMVRLADGVVHSEFDERFRNPELFGSPSYIIPPDATEFELPHKERFATFEEFMAEYCGYKSRDKKYNRYGHWQNIDRWRWVDAKDKEIGRTAGSEILSGMREDGASGLFLPSGTRHPAQIHLLHTMQPSAQSEKNSGSTTPLASETKIQHGCGSIHRDVGCATGSVQDINECYPISFPVRRVLISGQKWDWWVIGGRWTGHLLIGYDSAQDVDNYKECYLCHGSGTRADWAYAENDKYARQPTAAGHPVIGAGCNGCSGTGWEFKWSSELKPIGNYLRISQLNWKQIPEETYRKMERFLEEWQDFCNGKKFDFFEGPRNCALSLGLLDCKDVSELTGNEWKVIYWDKPDTPEDKKRHRCDVLKFTTMDWLVKNCFDAFSPVSTWAMLDDSGWKEKGKMGWWACNDATPESTREHAKGLVDWLKSGNQEDWLIIVDAHI
jgi:hypothetical protein